jgi:hypothetical protein
MAQPSRRQPSANVRERRNGHAKRDGNAAHPEVEALHRAADHCQAAFAYCATASNGIKDPAEFLCLVDCAQMCRTSADFILRQSTYMQPMRDLCMQQLCDAIETCSKYSENEVIAACVDAMKDAVDAITNGATEE